MFPSNLLVEASCNQKEIKLKNPEKDLNDFLSIDIPPTAQSTEDMYAFYESSLERQLDCVIPITLNKTPLHLKTLKDNLHNKGLISDVQIDSTNGQIAYFIVNVMGSNAGKRLVPLKEIDFTAQKIVDTQNFATCQLTSD